MVSLSPADVREIYGLRAAIEGRAARLLATDPAAPAVAELRELFGRMEEAVAAGDPPTVFRRDLEFHDGLCRLSGNARLHEVFVRYVPMLRALLRLDERVEASLDEIVTQHRPLVQAIEAGDAEEAARHAEEHSDHAGDLIAHYLETLPEHP